MTLQEMLEKFRQLEQQTLQLTHVCSEMRTKLRDAEKEKTVLRQQLDRQAEEIKKLSKRQAERQQNDDGNFYKINKLVSLINADSQETDLWKAVLDEYIQEINKCIAYLRQ
jgi:septal ring factor EnvC (AmiA/AmiB activator)